MDLIKWSEQFATGILGVDSEHEALIATINSFYSELKQDSNKEKLINILNNIYGSIHGHFMLEERLMKKHAYDEYPKHRQDHARLLDELRQITISLESEKVLNQEKLTQTLTDWFLTHFKTHDARLHKLEQMIAKIK